MTIEEIVKRLEEFQSPEELAATLLLLGLRGRLDGEHCPLAKATGKYVSKFTIWSNHRYVGVQMYPVEEVELPRVARIFVSKFDAKEFPELVLR